MKNVIYKDEILPVQLQAGDVVLFRNEIKWYRIDTWLSWAIRKATKFPYNHAAVITEANGELYINEALGKGIVKRPVKYLKRKTESYILILRPKDFVNPITYSIEADSHLGKRYDRTALIIHHLLYRIKGKWIGSTNQHAIEKMVCSEYAQFTHNRPNFWKASSKEVYQDKFYYVLWEERPLV